MQKEGNAAVNRLITLTLTYQRYRSFDWFADSGATKHMTDQLTILSNFKEINPEKWSVTGIGSTKLSAHGIGDVRVISSVNGEELNGVIKEVLYVPGLGMNLFSIGTATDKGNEVVK